LREAVHGVRTGDLFDGGPKLSRLVNGGGLKVDLTLGTCALEEDHVALVYGVDVLAKFLLLGLLTGHGLKELIALAVGLLHELFVNVRLGVVIRLSETLDLALLVGHVLLGKGALAEELLLVVEVDDGLPVVCPLLGREHLHSAVLPVGVGGVFVLALHHHVGAVVH